MIDRNIRELLNEDHDHLMTFPYEEAKSNYIFIGVPLDVQLPSSIINASPRLQF